MHVPFFIKLDIKYLKNPVLQYFVYKILHLIVFIYKGSETMSQLTCAAHILTCKHFFKLQKHQLKSLFCNSITVITSCLCSIQNSHTMMISPLFFRILFHNIHFFCNHPKGKTRWKFKYSLTHRKLIVRLN